MKFKFSDNNYSLWFCVCVWVVNLCPSFISVGNNRTQVLWMGKWETQGQGDTYLGRGKGATKSERAVGWIVLKRLLNATGNHIILCLLKITHIQVHIFNWSYATWGDSVPPRAIDYLTTQPQQLLREHHRRGFRKTVRAIDQGKMSAVR